MTDVFQRMDRAITDIPRWHRESRASASKHGYVKTGVGGWMLPIDPAKPDMNRALSFEIQSTVGHIANVAECKFYQHEKTRLGGAQAWRLLFTVHDSFVVECPTEDLDECAAWVKTCMEWKVPEIWGHKDLSFPVDVQFGPSWANLKHWSPKS
jgi:DNA polymerase I-like protein with 3'-5' exonuclease and polymerase domains